MSEHVNLRAVDGHELDAYVARPNGTPIAGLVVIQEAFGVNSHIRSVADGYARDGFLAIAPALFDRIERGVELGYEGKDWEKGIALAQQTNDNAVKDMDAALAWLREQKAGKSGVIGYCLGGTMAWLAATRLNIGAAVGYYGGHIARFAQETPRCPVMLHFGKLDKHIPKEDIDKVQALHPDVQVFWYDADHGFNCDQRGSHNPEAAKLARERSLAFLKQNLAS
jgi:carboxymethylenebutenolidase